MATLDDFMGREVDEEIIYLSNHETAWINACEIADIDPDELRNKQFEKERKRRKRK